MADTMLRQWTMLQLIPRGPRKITVQELVGRLRDHAFDVTERTVQRDLQKLSGSLFPLRVDERSRPHGWCWSEDAAVMDIPGMDPQTALGFTLAERFLRPLMAPSTLDALNPHFTQARRVLANAPAVVSNWPDKVFIQHRSQPLIAPAVPADVIATVYEALLREKRFAVDYQRRRDRNWQRHEVNPLAIVLRDGVIYLLARLFDYDDVLQLVLHRMRNAKLLDIDASPSAGFDTEAYLREHALDFPRGEIRLVFRMHGETAKHLGESPLSGDQVLSEQNDGWVRIEATVTETSQLHWWLLGFGDQVEVVAPAALREGLRERLRRALEHYSG